MENEKLLIDTSILIDYFRRTDKEKSRLINHFRRFQKIYITSITEFEIYNGATDSHKEFWDKMLTRIIVLDFDSLAAREAARIVSELKPKRKSIDKPDLFIAAIAIVNDLTFDTLNVKHFIHIDRLKLLSID
jgi:predicted nucleic acid-binding protein